MLDELDDKATEDPDIAPEDGTEDENSPEDDTEDEDEGRVVGEEPTLMAQLEAEEAKQVAEQEAALERNVYTLSGVRPLRKMAENSPVKLATTLKSSRVCYRGRGGQSYAPRMKAGSQTKKLVKPENNFIDKLKESSSSLSSGWFTKQIETLSAISRGNYQKVEAIVQYTGKPKIKYASDEQVLDRIRDLEERGSIHGAALCLDLSKGVARTLPPLPRGTYRVVTCSGSTEFCSPDGSRFPSLDLLLVHFHTQRLIRLEEMNFS